MTLVQSQSFIFLRSEWRGGHGGRSPEGKRRGGRSSCSPLRKKRRSQTPGAQGNGHNAHEVLKGILKSNYTEEQFSRSYHHKTSGEDKILEKEVKITSKMDTVPNPRGTKSRRSPSAGRRWGQESDGHSLIRNLGRSSSGWRRRSRSPYAGSRRGHLDKGSPQR